MSTKIQAENTAADINPPIFSNYKCAVITARWNNHITSRLRDGAMEAMRSVGLDENNWMTLTVPGAVELVHAAALAMKNTEIDAIIVLGCVIRGDTPHFDYVCQIVAQGIAMLNARGEKPVIFGVLTVDNEQQAMARAGGSLGNKGAEAAAAAIEMVNLDDQGCVSGDEWELIEEEE